MTSIGDVYMCHTFDPSLSSAITPQRAKISAHLDLNCQSYSHAILGDGGRVTASGVDVVRSQLLGGGGWHVGFRPKTASSDSPSKALWVPKECDPSKKSGCTLKFFPLVY